MTAPTPGQVVISREEERRARERAERMVELFPSMLIVLQCEEALDMPTEAGRAILERHGWDRAMRFDVPATKFVADLRRSVLAKAEALS